MKLALSVIIPAAGTSSRFGHASRSFVSKLMLPLGDQTVLEHSVSVFRSIPEIHDIVIAASPKLMKILKRQFRRAPKSGPSIKIVRGGRTRAQSVWLALKQTSSKTSHVLIHDGARPFIRPEWVRKLFGELDGTDGAVLGRPMIPTVKRL